MKVLKQFIEFEDVQKITELKELLNDVEVRKTLSLSLKIDLIRNCWKAFQGHYVFIWKG